MVARIDTFVFLRLSKYVYYHHPFFSNSSQYPNMIMMKFKETFYNVTAQKPQTGHPTMYDMVEIDDHVISNALVEQVILMGHFNR